MPEGDWISKFVMNGNFIAHILIKNLMGWKNLWLQSRTGFFKENMNICLVERTTSRVLCVLIFKCSYPVSQMSTKSTWEGTCFSGAQAITHDLSMSCAKQFFSLSSGLNTVLPLPLHISFTFVTFTQLDLTGHWLFQQHPLRDLLPFPSCFHAWGSFTEARAVMWRHSLYLLP